MLRGLRVWFPVAVCGLLILPAGVGAEEKEEKVALDKVPPAVMKTVKDKFPGARIKGAEKEEEDGKTSYEVSLTFEGHQFDVVLKPDGALVVIEKLIKAADLPKAVTKALHEKYPNAKIEKAEELTKGDQKTYEVVIETTAKKTFEVVLNPHGKILEEEEKKK